MTKSNIAQQRRRQPCEAVPISGRNERTAGACNQNVDNSANDRKNTSSPPRRFLVLFVTSSGGQLAWRLCPRTVVACTVPVRKRGKPASGPSPVQDASSRRDADEAQTPSWLRTGLTSPSSASQTRLAHITTNSIHCMTSIPLPDGRSLRAVKYRKGNILLKVWIKTFHIFSLGNLHFKENFAFIFYFTLFF